MPSDERKGDLEVEIFSAGNWNGDEYTVDDLQDIVKNFSLLKEEIKPPVKIGHEDNAMNKAVLDGQPAYGWVKELKVAGKKLVATISDIPNVLRTAIKKGLYKRVSSEIYWNLKKGQNVYKRVLSAVAFLGADAPAVTNLKDLEALFSLSTDGAAGSFERKAHYTFSSSINQTIINDEPKPKERSTEPMPDDVKMSAEELKKLQEDNVRLAASIDALNKSNLELKKSKAAERVREYCEGQVKALRMHPSTRDAIMRGIKEGKLNYDDATDSYQLPFDSFATIYDVKMKPSSPLPRGTQLGKLDIPRVATFSTEDDDFEGDEEEVKTYVDGSISYGANAGDKVDRMVKKYCAEKNVDYSTGMRAVIQANPKLAKQYIEATPIIRQESFSSGAGDVEEEG